jgi:uncharacterized membrane protein YebE (DUF533 family)
MAGGMMDLFDILLVKKLIGKANSGEITSPEAQEILKQLEEKASKDEVKAYVDSSIANLPALSEEEIINLTKQRSV